MMQADREHARRRIIAIATQIVASRIEKGEFDPKNDAALRKATRLAVSDATAAYHAAVEFVGG